MFVYVWQFDVAAERRAEFERVYGPDGEWVKLFRRSPDYLGTDLLRDRETPGRYLTVDRWRGAAERAEFLRRHARDVATLDERCVELTAAERRLGDFDVVG
jgi:heme-degrading monooxygenase HmoA